MGILPIFAGLLALISASAAQDLRPQFHFTAPTGWLNDPNGLVYQNGEYHLFYQHNPFGTGWGNMTWGHAVSHDLIRWTNLPNAIEPDSLGTIYSGSAVLDPTNSAGFGKNALVCMYTAAGGNNDASKGKPFTQCLAYSTNGRTFTKFTANPVIPNISNENRDPKVVWHAPSKKWVVALYVRQGTYELLGSKDLKTWTKLSEVDMPGTDECPDFYEIPLEGQKGVKKWVFSGANGNYRVGSFDGQEFHPETPVIRSHFGNTGYAAQTYSNAPGRRIQIEWMQGSDFPNQVWNQQMTFPNELTLRQTPEGPRLAFAPIREIASLRTKNSSGTSPNGLEVQLKSKLPSTGKVNIEINDVAILFDAATSKLSALGHEAILDIRSGELDLHIIADKTSIEIYAQNGLTWMPFFVLPKQDGPRTVHIHTEGDWHPKTQIHELAP